MQNWVLIKMKIRKGRDSNLPELVEYLEYNLW